MFYGTRAVFQRLFAGIILLTMFIGTALSANQDQSHDEIVIVAFGDSLTAGFMLPPQDAFPNQLEAALKKRGHKVRVINAGLSGDTAAGGLARLEWVMPKDADAVIVELGANDALRGLDPAKTKATLDKIVAALKAKGLGVLLTGMEAPRNLGADYVKKFGAIYPALANKHGVPLYPFFLEGIAGDPKLNLPDGLHPNTEGVGVIVDRILPAIEALIAKLNQTKS